MNIFNNIKEASKQAENLAQKKLLREAVTTAETALNMWAEQPGFWERLLGKLLISNIVETLKQQLVQWKGKVAEVDKLANSAKTLLKQDTGNPEETQLLINAIGIYQRCSLILYDQQIMQTIQQYQQELQRRQQFQLWVNQGKSQAETRFFKQAITAYQQAEKLYPTEAVKQAIIAAQAQVPHEEIYTSTLQSAQQAIREGKLKKAIGLLTSALNKFHRADGLNLLQKLESTLKGREIFRQGLAAEKAGYLPAATTLYENAKSLLPDAINCSIRLGIIAIKTQDWTTALSHLENISGEQAAYLRGFALAQQDNLQLAYREWQGISAVSIHEQREILKHLSQRQRLLSLQKIEQLVKAEDFAAAHIVSREFIQKFGVDPVVEFNLNQHILPRLEVGIWQNPDWGIIAETAEKAWINQPNITTLHNWAVATYYLAQKDPTKLFNLIIALSTALANITIDPILQDVPWLGNQPVDFKSLSLELNHRLEVAIDNIKDINIQEYLKLRDYLRLELVALKFMDTSLKSGMKINDILIHPGCYHHFIYQWRENIVDRIDAKQKILRSLYTPWGLAVAACLEGDSQRAIQLKPSTNNTTIIDKFAQSFVAYHEGCYHLQQQNWRTAIIHLKLAKSEIQEHLFWQQEIDKLCGLQRQDIYEFTEHLELAEFWYELLGSKSASSYLAEYRAEKLRQQVINKQISLDKALDKLRELQQIDNDNPVVIDLIENIELTQELEEIDWLLKQQRFEEVVNKARYSQRERVRYIVAEFFINTLINSVENGQFNDIESIQQLGNWAYEICPDEPAFQEIYRNLKLC
jgi:hypothetical protein